MKSKAILTITIAALLVSSAAICTSAQSGNSAKHKANAAKAAVKPNEPAPASKQNERPKTSVAPVVEPSNASNETSASPAPQSATPAKQNNREPASSAPLSSETQVAADAVQYGYEFKQPDFFISSIVIEHDANGRGRITFQRKDSEQSVVEPLALSTIALARVTTLWNALRFLDSEIDYQADRQFPHLGTMRLRMKRGERERVAAFNWTKDHDALALVTEYRRAADQALFVFDITLSRENQPLEAPKLIDRLDSLVKTGGLSDSQQLLPLLRDLVTDERLPLIARNHAGRVLKILEKGIATNHK
jgi:hypothetical protein